MRLAIPTQDGVLFEHFGGSSLFAIVDVDLQSKSVLKNEYVTPPKHEPGVFPTWIGELGADVVVARGMGQRAQDMLSAKNITVITGAPLVAVDSLVASYLDGTLKSVDFKCDHHHHEH